jgi:transposase
MGGAMSRFESVKDGMVALVRSGLSVDEAASREGVNIHTVRSWLSKGRKEPQGRYGRFASEVDAMRSLQTLPDRSKLGAFTRDELERLLAEKIRAGSVPAMRLWVDLHRAEFEPGEGIADDPFAEFDSA